MLGQDIIHAATNSQVKTPKHIGLAVTIYQLTGSKEVVTLLNRMGHCSSFDDFEIVNTAWAREMEARSQQTGVVIPSNITAGPFVQFAADNNDFNEETRWQINHTRHNARSVSAPTFWTPTPTEDRGRPLHLKKTFRAASSGSTHARVQCAW